IVTRVAPVLIAGPTTSGKSALALSLAERFGGVIINADSMQVYGDLRIITARPSASEEARVPHRLYGHVDAAENYSVGHWCVDARMMPADRARVTRALEVVLATGRSLSDWHREGLPAVIDSASAIKIFLAVDRSELYRRIDRRFDTMLDKGAIEEVKALAARGL